LRDLGWFDEVRRALDEDRLIIYGQPITDVATRSVVKHELLLRMISSAGDVIGPDQFLPSAEKYGLIGAIDRWVFTQAAELAATGEAVTVNLSAVSVGDATMLLHIEREIARTGTDTACLTFEVTETAVMQDLEGGRRFADRLTKLGCSFALDDFGTGYGSLTYLRQLPVDYLKIDIEFVRNMTRSESDRALVQTIVSMAKSLGKRTIAEGVEDEETFQLLVDLGIDFAQGFHLGRPAPFSPKTIESQALTQSVPSGRAA
jgi:EAL domain-containing protein (putative c-di-GMP-specific phosphodiesterase class I)